MGERAAIRWGWRKCIIMPVAMDSRMFCSSISRGWITAASFLVFVMSLPPQGKVPCQVSVDPTTGSWSINPLETKPEWHLQKVVQMVAQRSWRRPARSWGLLDLSGKICLCVPRYPWQEYTGWKDSKLHRLLHAPLSVHPRCR